jgi:8-oxo-dGTP diphosphatase
MTPEPALIDARRLRLVRLHESPEDATAVYAPLTHALVIARHADAFLLVRSRRLRAWELPGGHIDAGETPRECAAREFREETGQPAPALRWRGVIELETTGDGALQRHFGALFCADLEAVALTPHSDDEIEQIGVWPIDALPSPTSAIDAALLRLFR